MNAKTKRYEVLAEALNCGAFQNDGAHQIPAGLLVTFEVDELMVFVARIERSAVGEMSAAQIEKGWRDTFSTENPFCPCDLKSFTKAVNWAQRFVAASIERNGAAS